jgi:hypothetical protein
VTAEPSRDEWEAEERWHDMLLATNANVVRVSDVSRERVQWLWPGRMPRGKLVMVDGDPGLGKSTLMLDCAAKISTGSPWPDGAPCDCGDVILLSAEDGIADTIRPRLEAARADLDRVHAFQAVLAEDGQAAPPSIPRDLDTLERVVEETGALLVIVDVLSAFLSSHVDSHRDQDVRSALMPLAKLAERTGACVVALRHLNKAGGANALYRGGGSIGIIGAARVGMLVAPDPEDGSRAVTKSNLAAIPPSLVYRIVTDDEFECGRIAWDGESRHSAGDLLAGPSNDEERSARDEAVEFLRDVLAGCPMPAREVKRLAREAGIAERTLDRARKRAGVVTRKEGFGGKWVWALTSSPTDAPFSP